MTTACTQCAKRKTRCDLVTEAGCHRCQVLRTDCSLKQEEVAPVPFTSTTARDRIQLSVSSERELRRSYHDRLRSRSPSYYESSGRTGTSTAARLDQVESRLDRLDQLVSGGRLGASRPAVSSTTDEPLDWRKMGLLAPLSISSMAYLAMGLRQATFEDPVESGTVSRAEWTAIYERLVGKRFGSGCGAASSADKARLVLIGTGFGCRSTRSSLYKTWDSFPRSLRSIRSSGPLRSIISPASGIRTHCP
jgi:hypothetical protein